MQRSTLLRAELEDAVAGLTPAARAVFEDIQRTDEDAEPELPEGFGAPPAPGQLPKKIKGVDSTGPLIKGGSLPFLGPSSSSLFRARV